MDIKSYLKNSAFKLNLKEKEKRLLPLFQEAHCYHYQNNTLYQKVIDNEYARDMVFDSLGSLPFLPVSYFKQSGKAFTSSRDVHRSLFSSSTSGVPSVIEIDRETSKRQVLSLASSLSNFIGKQRRPFLICDIPPQKANFDLSARHGAVSGFTHFSSESNFILQVKNAGYQLDTTLLEEIWSRNADEPMIICGFTFLVYIYLIKFCKERQIRFNFPANSYLIHIGGWKKLADQKVSREQFIQDAVETLHIKPENIVDIYGFTEQMGTIYPECQHGFKHVPDHAHLIVRDPYSYDMLKVGQTGVGQFLSLVPRSYAGFSLMTDDLVQVSGHDDCQCGRQGTYFKVIGRAKSAELRGCGDVIATKIMQKSAMASADQKAVLYYRKSKECDQPITNWDLVSNELKCAQKELQKLSIDDMMLLFKAAAQNWQSDPELTSFKTQGLDFITSWILTGQFEENLDLSLRGSKHHLDDFVTHRTSNKKLIAFPRGIVTHWLAGNVPTLGIISLMISIACKNANLVKVSKTSLRVLQKMMSMMADIEVTNLSGRRLQGKLITDAVYLVYVDRHSNENKKLSTLADVRIAWGGKEAIESIIDFPKKYDAEDIIFGPKLSLSAIGRESMQVERKVNRIARSVAMDASIFDQKACASSHNVFIEKGGAVSTQRFVEMLQVRMDEVAEKIPADRTDFNNFDQVRSARLLAYQQDQFTHMAIPLHAKWTLFVNDKLELNQPVYGRTLFIHEVDHLEDVANLLSSENQVVGLELKSSRRDAVSQLFLQQGVSRIAMVGHMADFAFPWDDMFPTEKLVRWCYV